MGNGNSTAKKSSNHDSKVQFGSKNEIRIDERESMRASK